MESDDFIHNDNYNVELFIYEEGDLRPNVERAEKAPPIMHSTEHGYLSEINNGMSDKKRCRNISDGSVSQVARLTRTRSMPGSLKRSISFMRSYKLLQKYKITNETHSDNLSNVLSGLYAMFIVVLGASIPIAKVFAVDISVQTLEGFYLYLFLAGILFIIYVYLVLIHDMNPIRYIKQCTKRQNTPVAAEDSKNEIGPASEKKFLESEAGETSSIQPSASFTSDGVLSSATDRRSVHFSFNTKSGSESFYLRLGAVAFGIGSVIHNGLEFGQFLEKSQSPECAFDFIIIIRPIIQLIFTFMQLYFIFINSKLRIHSYCTVARFGTMHMIATNLCVWLRVITIETVREIQKFVSGDIGELLGFGDVIGEDQDSHSNILSAKKNMSSSASGSHDSHHGGHRRAAADPSHHHHDEHHLPTVVPALMTTDSHLPCQQSSLMTNLLNSASPYLYPCAIEYCLIAAAIMFLIWNNIDQPHHIDRDPSFRSTGSASDLHSTLFGKRNRVSVDCSGANRGLFSGIFIFVLTIISIIVFFIFIDSSEHTHLAIAVEHVSLIVLYTLALVAVVLAAFRFRDMKFRPKRERMLDETLLVLSLIGVYMFRIFSSIAGQYSIDQQEGSLVLAANIIITLQATIQTVFILNGLRRCARTPRQEVRKPGREYVTFLLICNISIWATNTFEVLRSDANPVSMNFYGPVPWSIITHVATPLTIFHQFHATVCLSTIWKTAYKLKAT